MENLGEVLEVNDVILVKIKSDVYTKNIKEIAKILSSKNKLLFITLNKSSDSLISSFKKYKINVGNIYFLDAITRTFTKPRRIKNSTFVRSPQALTEIGIEFTKIIKKFKPDCIVFDSLSTLIIYEDDIRTGLNRFITSIINKALRNNLKIIFFCLKSDENSRLIKNISIVAEKIINI